MLDPHTRILVYGAGAIGSCLGALLADHGADVTLLARGPHADAMQRAGAVSLVEAGGRDRAVPVKVCRPGECDGRYDLVFVTLKSTQVAGCARDLMEVVAPEGALVMVQNGLPWWYFQDVDLPWRGTALRSLDPDGTLARVIDLRRVIGATVRQPASLLEPGVVSAARVAYRKLVIGEIAGGLSARCADIAALLDASDFPCDVSQDIRAAKWDKLMVNLVWNPITALTQASQGHVSAYAPAAALFASVLEEGRAVAASVGITVDLDADAELRRVAGRFDGLPSMLQDVRAGRALEVDSILNAVLEIAALTETPVPALRTIAALTSLLDQRIQSDRVRVVALDS